MTTHTNALTTKTTARIAELKETIALCTADLRHCNTRAQVQSVNSVIAARRAELLALEEQAFINRTVTVLDDAPMGTHSVYVHWFRIDYGCWLDAEEVVLAGGLADYLESLGLSAADVAELMVQDWDCQDAEGLASRCIGNYGGFDWMQLESLLEVDVEPAVLVAGLECGLEPDAIEDAYMGEWDSAEDMAFDQWDQCGMLESIPESARGYINWELVARDMVLSGDVVEANGHYFMAA